ALTVHGHGERAGGRAAQEVVGVVVEEGPAVLALPDRPVEAAWHDALAHVVPDGVLAPGVVLVVEHRGVAHDRLGAVVPLAQADGHFAEAAFGHGQVL